MVNKWFLPATGESSLQLRLLSVQGDQAVTPVGSGQDTPVPPSPQ